MNDNAHRHVAWKGRRWASWLVRALVVVGPLAMSIAAAWALSSLTPTPSTVVTALLRWVAIAAASTVVLFLAERAFRRLLPLATLLRLTLSFPDRAPSRFRIALRTGSTRHLRERIAEARAGRLGETPAEAATRVLELVAALSLHDALTRGHSERVRAYTQMLAEEMGITGRDLDRIRWAGLLHDIGKLLVPTEILNKPGRLTDEEFEIVKTHPEHGRTLVRPLLGWLGEPARAVWEHHERWAGGGYPFGIAGADISRAARIVSVADTYDVITSVRSYKSRVSARDARAELARCAGSQFDPAVVRAFLNLSIARVGRVTGPVSWLTQWTMFPTGVFTKAATSGAVAVTAAGGVVSAAVGSAITDDPPPAAERVIGDRPAVGTDLPSPVQILSGDPTETIVPLADPTVPSTIAPSTAPPTSAAPRAATTASTIATTLPTVPTTIPTLPTLPPSLPTVPTTIPTLPTLPPLLPTVPTTIPTLPTTIPTLPTTIPTLPTLPTTLPTLPTLPTMPTTLPNLPTTIPTLPTTIVPTTITLPDLPG